MSSQLVQMSGALFAGVVSLAGVLVARGVRVSEFRQAWIEALRADLAALIAHVINAINERRFANEQRAAKERARAATEPEATTAEDYEPDHADVVRIEEALAMIELRLSRTETKARCLLERAKAVGGMVQLDKPVNREKLQQAVRRLLETSTRTCRSRTSKRQPQQAVRRLLETSTDYLKGEWKRVKRGETQYHWCLGISIMVGVIGFVFLAWAVAVGPATAEPDGAAVPGIEEQLPTDGAEGAGAGPGMLKTGWKARRGNP